MPIEIFISEIWLHHSPSPNSTNIFKDFDSYDVLFRNTLQMLMQEKNHSQTNIKGNVFVLIPDTRVMETCVQLCNNQSPHLDQWWVKGKYWSSHYNGTWQWARGISQQASILPLMLMCRKQKRYMGFLFCENCGAFCIWLPCF